MILALELTRRGATALLGAISDDGSLKIEARHDVAFASGLAPAPMWLGAIEAAREVCEKANIPLAETLVSFAFDGPLDGAGRVLSSSETAGWAGYDLARGLHEHLGAQNPLVQSRSMALGRAEARLGALQNAENWLLVTLDRRVEGAARIGKRFWTPEVGAMLLERDGALDQNGRRGTLAAYCTPEALHSAAASYGFNFDQLADLWQIRASNFAAQSLVEEFTERLAQGLCNLIIALRPEALCIGGATGRALWPFLEQDLIFKLREFTAPRALEGLQLRVSNLENDAGALGALTLGLEALEAERFQTSSAER